MKPHKLHKGGLTDLKELDTRYHSDSVHKRRDKLEEAETGVPKDRSRWTPEQDDLALDLSEKGLINSLKHKIPGKSIRARRIRVQHLASREREYAGTLARRRCRWNTAWTKWDDTIFKMATTFAALCNGAADANYIAKLLGRSEEEVLEKYGGALIRIKEQYKS